MKKYILLVLGLMFSYSLFSQMVKVADKTNLQPLSNVEIFSEKPRATALTNNKGWADLSDFKGSDSIWFSHVSYSNKTYSYAELLAIDFKVFLSEISFSVDEVVVSASRFEEKASDVAQPIQVIKAKEMAFINQQTTAEVMQNSGNVMVQKSQLGGGSPVIRGFETNKVLMVVDGVRMNNAIYRGGHLQNIITLDNSVMERMEIVFGPGSVVYGSDALGGVMHFYTKKPVLADTAGTILRVNAFTRYSTAYDEKTGHIDFSLGSQKFGSLTSVSYSDFGDLRQGNSRNPFYGDWGKRTFYAERINGVDTMLVNKDVNLQKQSGYKQYDVLQKFLFKQSDKVSHQINFQYSTSSDIPRYDRLTQMSGSNPKYAEWYYGPQSRLFAAYTLSLINDHGFYDNARVILAYQNLEESRNSRKFKKEILSHQVEKLNIVSLNIDLAKKMKKQEVRYGLDGWFNDVKSSAFDKNIISEEEVTASSRYPDGGSTMASLAAYITHTFEINKKFIFSDGIRVNNIQLNANFKDTTFFPFPFHEVSQNNTAVNGNLGLIIMPGAGWRFSVIGSSGFRAPNVDDLSKVFESSPGDVIVPNPNLKPEYTYNGDAGFSKAFKGNVTIGGNAYYTIYRNAITTSTGNLNGNDSIVFDGVMSRVTMNVNATEAYIYGFSTYLNADISEAFSINSTLNYTYGRIKTDTIDYPLDHISPMFGKTSFNLKIAKFKGEFFVLYSGAKASKDYNLLGEDNETNSADPQNGYMPAWITLNIRTAYQFNKYAQLQVALENILDENYRVFASNISSPGRNLVVTFRANF